MKAAFLGRIGAAQHFQQLLENMKLLLTQTGKGVRSDDRTLIHKDNNGTGEV